MEGRKKERYMERKKERKKDQGEKSDVYYMFFVPAERSSWGDYETGSVRVCVCVCVCVCVSVRPGSKC